MVKNQLIYIQSGLGLQVNSFLKDIQNSILYIIQNLYINDLYVEPVILNSEGEHIMN